MTAASSPTSAAVPLIGRDAELAALRAALDRMGGGDRAVVAIVAPGGMGKTSLLTELGRAAQAAGLPVLPGRGAEYEREQPFSLIVDALDDAVADADPRTLATLGPDRIADLATVLPSVEDLADAAFGPGAIAGPSGGGGAVATAAERPRYHRAVRALLEVLTSSRGFVLVLDDVHWADEATVELVLHLLRRPPRIPHVIALGMRPGDVESRMTAALRDARGERIELAPLADRDARTLVEAIAGQAAEQVVRDAAGNPFYLRELARASSACSVQPSTPAANGLPAPIAAAISVDVERLPDAARELLRGAAVAGDPADADLAAAAADIPADQVAPALYALRRADVVLPADRPGLLRFRHPIVRRAVYEASPPGWRLAAHRRAAAALQASGASPAGLAHHLEQAAQPGDEEAIALLIAAGEEVMARDPLAAARWHDAALRLLPVAEEIRRSIQLERMADALFAAGRLEGAHDALLDAIELLHPYDADGHARLTATIAGAEHLLGRHEDAQRRLLATLRRLGDRPSKSVGSVEVELAVNGVYRLDPPAILEWSDRAATTAREVGDRPLLANAQALRALAELWSGRLEEAHRLRDAAANAVAGLEDSELCDRIDTPYYLAIAGLLTERYAQAEAVTRRGLALARSSGQDRAVLPLLLVRAMIRHNAMHTKEALELIEEAEDAARLAGNPALLHWALWLRSNMLSTAGQLEESLQAGDESMTIAATLEDSLLVRTGIANVGASYLTAGDAERCRSIMIESSGPHLEGTEPSWRCYLLEALTRAHLALGDVEAARETVEHVEAHAAWMQLPVTTGWARCARGALLVHEGEPAEAARVAAEAAADADKADALLHATTARLLQGRALAAAGERDAALAVLDRVASDAGAHGTHLYRELAVQEQRRLGRRVPRPGARGAGETGLDALSARERELAELVAEGLTNKQIAARVFLSEKTVEHHLRSAFAKVGVKSRTELAAAVAGAR